MPTLSNIKGSSLIPDASSGLNLLLSTFGTKQSREKEQAERDKQEALQGQIDILAGAEDQEKEAALIRIAQLAGAPVSKEFRAILDRGNAVELSEAKTEIDKNARLALLIQREKTFAGKQRVITQEAAAAGSRGEDVKRFLELANLPEGQLNNKLTKMELLAADLGQLTTNRQKLLQKQQFGEQGGAPGGAIIKASEISDGFIVRQQPDGTFTKTKVLESASTSDPGKASAVTKIFDNGTTIQALPNGKVLVKNPAGEVVTGEGRIKTLQDARKEEIAFTGTRKGTEAAASAAIRQSEKAFERIAKVKTSIINIDKAIDALDRGADTGPIISKLPSIRAASVELDNIQKAMGLDVIGNVTFGALSKGELDLALSKAVPTGLRPQALRRWLVDKKAAQEKLAAYVEDAAVYLGTPGNTIPGWLEAQEALSTVEPGAENAGDANTGNTTPEGFSIFQRPDGSTYAISP